MMPIYYPTTSTFFGTPFIDSFNQSQILAIPIDQQKIKQKSRLNEFLKIFIKSKKSNITSSNELKTIQKLPSIAHANLEIPPSLSSYPAQDYEFGYRLPFNWILYNDKHFIQITPDSREFTTILNYLINNGLDKPTRVVSLKRIQNKRLYIQYQALKDEFSRKYSHSFEYTLFHGTKEKNVQSICEKGFNRSYAGHCYYGKGVYFSNSAKYSSLYTSKAFGKQGHIFICKVLVGSIELGESKTVVPKKADSTVDNLKSPSIFVTYNDAQAYPDYLLTYE